MTQPTHSTIIVLVEFPTFRKFFIPDPMPTNLPTLTDEFVHRISLRHRHSISRIPQISGKIPVVDVCGLFDPTARSEKAYCCYVPNSSRPTST